MADEREIHGVVTLERRKRRRDDGLGPMVSAHGVQGNCDLATHAGLGFERGAKLGDRQQREAKATTLARRPAARRKPSCRGRNRRPSHDDGDASRRWWHPPTTSGRSMHRANDACHAGKASCGSSELPLLKSPRTKTRAADLRPLTLPGELPRQATTVLDARVLGHQRNRDDDLVLNQLRRPKPLVFQLERLETRRYRRR